MTPYEILFARHLKNIYKRGRYKGDAPMEKRAKTDFRIIKGENMVVRMYRTDILTAFRNGEFEINLDGWSASSTTKANINHVLGAIQQRMYIGTKVIMGVRQTVVHTLKGIYLYYDGVRFNQEGELVTEPHRFEARRIDKAESKAFMDNLKTSGFKGVFPVLYATAQAQDYEEPPLDRHWAHSLQDVDCAVSWPEIVMWFKFDKGWHYTPATRNHVVGVFEIGTAKSCWTRMMAQAKTNMYDTTRTEVTRLDV